MKTNLYIQRIHSAIAYGRDSDYGLRIWLYLRDVWYLCRYYDENFFPIECPVCGSIHFRDVVTHELEGITTEYDIECERCDSRLASWIHGDIEFGSWLMPDMVKMVREDMSIEGFNLYEAGVTNEKP